MKKLTGIILMFALLLSGITVFAETPIEKYNSAWNQKYLSGVLDYSISTKLSAPLSSYLDPDGTITEALNNAKISYNMKYKTNENSNALIADMLVSIDGFTKDMPNIKMQTWIDMDLSDDNNLKYNIIMKYIEPKEEFGAMADKYMIMDYTKIPGMLDMLKSMKSTGLFDVTKAQELQKTMMAGIEDKITPEFNNGVYTLILDETTVKNVLQTVSINMFDTVTKYIFEKVSSGGLGNSLVMPGLPNGTQMTDTQAAEAKKSITEFFGKIADIQIFDSKSAIQLDTTLDDEGLLKTVKYTININANAAKLAKAFEIPNIPEELTEQNSNIAGTLILDMKYDKTNQPVEITFPEITAENSINMLNMMNNTVPNEDGITVLYNTQKIEYSDKPITDAEGNVMLPLRETLNALGIPNEDITYEDGIVSVVYLDKVITFSVDSDYTGAYINGEEVTLSPAPQLINDKTYVSDSFISETLGFKLNSTSVNKSYVLSITD